MANIQINETISLHYDELGTSDRYLFCCQEGFHGDQAYFKLLAEAGFHIIAIQIRGFGESTHVFEDHGNKWWEIWADDAIAVADKLGIERFFYVGASHGAGIGWYLCVRHPERLRGFFGIVPGPHARGGLETSAARLAVITAAQSRETWVEYVKATFGERPEPVGGESEAELAEIAKRAAGYDAFMARPLECSRINPKKPFFECKTEEELCALLHTITVPTLLLAGLQDDISTKEMVLRSGNAVPNAKTVFYEATHSLCGERPQEVADDILLFCRQRNLF